MIPEMIFIVGPTAVGKSDAAVALAQKINGEIVSCDSMQVYREVRIASSRPSLDQLRKVPHHLTGCVSVTEVFDVNRYVGMALLVIEDILKRKKTPVVCGGSGLYAGALLDGIFEGEGANLPLRESLLEQARDQGADALYRRLEGLDPAAAQKIHPNNVKRVIRALEVCLTTRCLFSELQKERRGLWDQYRVRMFGLSMPRQDLYERINLRVSVMLEEGLVEEVRALDHLPLSRTAGYLIGVREIREYLDGRCDLQAAAEAIRLNTRHLAKRQMTWFRKDERVEWIEIEPQVDAKKVVDQISAKIA